jgi:tRNA(Leu) C34 or U34 (ribose-2'-O)-methylase TrmL
MANMIQLVVSLDAKIYATGSSISFGDKKIMGKIHSWGINELPEIEYCESFEKQVQWLKDKGKLLIGTSPRASENFYTLDLSNVDPVFVLGTESSGLTLTKQSLLDKMIYVPMSKKLSFMTLSVVVPAIAYECYRQINFGK